MMQKATKVYKGSAYFRGERPQVIEIQAKSAQEQMSKVKTPVRFVPRQDDGALAAIMAKCDNISAMCQATNKRIDASQAQIDNIQFGISNIDRQVQLMDEIKARIDQKMAAKVEEAKAYGQ